MPYNSSTPNLGDLGTYVGNSLPYTMSGLYRGAGMGVLDITENAGVPTSGAISLNSFRNTNIWANRSYPSAVVNTQVPLVIGSVDLGKAGAYYGYDTAVAGGSGYAFGSFYGKSGSGPNYDGSPTAPSDRPYFTTPTGTYVIRALYGSGTTTYLILTGTSGYPPDSDYGFKQIIIKNTAGTVTYLAANRNQRVSVYSYPYWYYRTVWTFTGSNSWPTSGTVNVTFTYIG